MRRVLSASTPPRPLVAKTPASLLYFHIPPRIPLSPSKTLITVSTAFALLLAVRLPAQPIPVSYSVHLASATSYDTRSRDEDTIHASLAVFVNGERKDLSIWDGVGWDGSRTEGRKWVTGLHLFGPSTGSSVKVVTGRLEDSDSIQIVYQIFNAGESPSSSNHESVATRIQQSKCEGGDGVSAWDCLSPLADQLVAGLPFSRCDGLVGAEKLVFTAMQLRRRTETGDTVTISNLYRGIAAPAACGQSIYSAMVTIARQ
jgi:hypothetical protein